MTRLLSMVFLVACSVAQIALTVAISYFLVAAFGPQFKHRR
jgi:hypothetical protein